MPISTIELKQLKENGLDYSSFLAGAEYEHREKYEASYTRYQLSHTQLAKLNALPEIYDVFVLTAHNCGDSMTNLPLLAKLEAETKKLKLHILLRDEYTELHQRYLHKDGKPHIPTYIFFNQAGEELGVFIERPDAVSQLSDQWANEFWDAHPELEGRGLPLGELDPEIKLKLVTQLRALRPTAYELEQDEILTIIHNIIRK